MRKMEASGGPSRLFSITMKENTVARRVVGRRATNENSRSTAS
jgi:hypothetical protein